MLGNGGGEMQRIPAEFTKSLFHKRGALAGARDNNPEKASSACQFYIVQGRKYTSAELDMFEMNSGNKFSPEARSAYLNEGGTPMLDNNYTVFGEVEIGIDVVDKIAGVQRDRSDRPVGDIHMYMEIIK